MPLDCGYTYQLSGLRCDMAATNSPGMMSLPLTSMVFDPPGTVKLVPSSLKLQGDENAVLFCAEITEDAGHLFIYLFIYFGRTAIV